MRIEVLDHGYVEVVESWGADERIIEAARMSTGKGFQGWQQPYYYRCQHCDYTCERERSDDVMICPNDVGRGDHGFPMVYVEPPLGDEKLLRFLYTHAHMTPFEMAGMIVEVQAPIFVFREWHRHRTQSYNELSARYTPLPDVNYIPTSERLLIDGGTNKQATSTGKMLSPTMAGWFRQALKIGYGESQRLYEAALSEGVPKELARLIVPVGRYSRMRASANLRNWLAFMTLRCAPNAQYEIRMFANAVSQLIADKFPRTHALWAEFETQLVPRTQV